MLAGISGWPGAGAAGAGSVRPTGGMRPTSSESAPLTSVATTYSSAGLLLLSMAAGCEDSAGVTDRGSDEEATNTVLGFTNSTVGA